MASIYKVSYPSGTKMFRVMIRNKIAPRFSLNFDTWESACDWVEENEIKYLENPEHYFEWKKDFYAKMRRNREIVKNHVIRQRRYSYGGL